jgi:hypothetical protein
MPAVWWQGGLSGFRLKLGINLPFPESLPNCHGERADPSFPLRSVADSPHCAVVRIAGLRIPPDLKTLCPQLSYVDALGSMRRVLHVVQQVEAICDHPFLDVDRHTAVPITRFRVCSALDSSYPRLRIRIQIVGCNMPDDVMLVADFLVIMGKGITIGITRWIEGHSNGGTLDLPRKCGSKKVTQAGEFGCRLPLVLGTCRAVKMVDRDLVGLHDLDLDLNRRACP